MATTLKILAAGLLVIACSGPRETTAPTVPVPVPAEVPAPAPRSTVWDTDFLAEWIGERNLDVTTCYESIKVRVPETGGKIRVRLRFATDGRMDSLIFLSNSTGSADLETCMKRRMKNWRLPKGMGTEPIWVEVPYEFTDWISGGDSADSIRTAQEIRDFCLSNQSMIGQCLESVSEMDKSGTITVGIAFAIQPDGLVRDVRVTQLPDDQESLELCILNRVRQWKFRPVTSNIIQPFSITFTFTF